MQLQECPRVLQDRLNFVKENVLDVGYVIKKLLIIMWFLWKGRNELVFKSKQVDPLYVLQKTNAYQKEINEASIDNRTTDMPQNSHTQNIHQVSKRWKKPQDGFYKVNSNATYDKS